MKFPKTVIAEGLSAKDTKYLSERVNLGSSICFDLTPNMVNAVAEDKPILPQYFPFKDLFFIVDVESFDADGIVYNEDMNIVIRAIVEDGQLRLIVTNPTKNGWVLLGVFEYNAFNDMMEMVIINHTLADERQALLDVINTTCRSALRALSWMEFQRDETTALTGLAKTKVKPAEQERYISYMLDLTKPMKKYKCKQMGGTHASPIEHERRGHWRT